MCIIYPAAMRYFCFFPEKIKNAIFEQLRAVSSPSASIPELNAVAELGAFFFSFMPRAHRANEVTYLRLPPASCHRLRNHSPEHNFPHLRAAGSESVATAVCRHAGSTLLSARGGGKHAWERAEQGPGRAAAGTRGRVSMTAPSAEPRPGRAPRRPLIGRPRFVALLLRRCPPLIGGALAAGVRAQVSLPAPGGQGPLPEALAQHEAPRRGRVGGRAALSHVPAASRRRSRPLRGLGAAEGSALGAEPAGAAIGRAHV